MLISCCYYLVVMSSNCCMSGSFHSRHVCPCSSVLSQQRGSILQSINHRNQKSESSYIKTICHIMQQHSQQLVMAMILIQRHAVYKSLHQKLPAYANVCFHVTHEECHFDTATRSISTAHAINTPSFCRTNVKPTRIPEIKFCFRFSVDLSPNIYVSVINSVLVEVCVNNMRGAWHLFFFTFCTTVQARINFTAFTLADFI